MKEIKNFMPERFYSLDNDMSFEKIQQAKVNDYFLVAKVVRWDSQLNCFRVDLGNSFNGIIPLHEISLYPSTRPNGNLTPAIYTLIGHTVCVCVQEICEDNTIILSRKSNMLKAFNHFSHANSDVISCSIQSVAPYGLFVDIGHGISGLIYSMNLSYVKMINPIDIGFAVGQSIDAKIIAINYEKYHIQLDHRNLVENFANVLNTGDIIECISLLPLNKSQNATFVYINENTPALMDIPEGLEVKYGSKVLARVKNFKPNHPNRLRLDFISFIV